MGMNKQELIQEYVKCHGNTPYALKTYLQTYDNTQQKHVPFELFPEQKEMIYDFGPKPKSYIIAGRPMPPIHHSETIAGCAFTAWK